MKQQASIHVCSMALIAFALTLLIPSFIQPSASADAETSFSVIQITDTQHLSEDNPSYYDNLCQWIVDNNDTYNVKMVVHTGDIVSDEDKRSQWLNANHSMGILLDNDIPYCWDAGNHDYDNDCWIGNQFTAFNPEVMQTKSYWVSTAYNGMNTAVHFNVSGWDCLIVNVAFHANESVLEWANGILDANPQSHAIVTTHDYLNRGCEYDSWGVNFSRTVLDSHANVFLTLSGHYHPTLGNRTRVGERDELLFDMQDADDELGSASARILTFDTAKGTIKVQTYSVYSNQFLEDPDSSFVLNTSFRNNLAGIEPIEFPVVLVAVVLVVLCSVILCLLYIQKRAKKRAQWLGNFVCF